MLKFPARSIGLSYPRTAPLTLSLLLRRDFLLAATSHIDDCALSFSHLPVSSHVEKQSERTFQAVEFQQSRRIRIITTVYCLATQPRPPLRFKVNRHCMNWNNGTGHGLYRELLRLAERYYVQEVVFMDKNCTKQAELLLLLLLLHGSGGRQGGAPCFESRRPRIHRSRRPTNTPERQQRPLRLSSHAAIFEREIRRLDTFGAIVTKPRSIYLTNRDSKKLLRAEHAFLY